MMPSLHLFALFLTGAFTFWPGSVFHSEFLFLPFSVGVFRAEKDGFRRLRGTEYVASL
tara:strand:- start:3921 stop:4094 length:174 start_codon:yes stop_codon:yes gene_type:complete